MCTFFVFALERLRAIIGADYLVFTFYVTFLIVCIGELPLSAWPWYGTDCSRHLVSVDQDLACQLPKFVAIVWTPSGYFPIIMHRIGPSLRIDP